MISHHNKLHQVFFGLENNLFKLLPCLEDEPKVKDLVRSMLDRNREFFFNLSTDLTGFVSVNVSDDLPMPWIRSPTFSTHCSSQVFFEVTLPLGTTSSSVTTKMSQSTCSSTMPTSDLLLRAICWMLLDGDALLSKPIFFSFLSKERMV